MQPPIAGITYLVMRTNPTQVTKNMKKKYNSLFRKSLNCYLLSLKPRKSRRKRKRILCLLMQRRSLEGDNLHISRPSRVVSRHKN